MDPRLSILEHVVKPGTVEHGTADQPTEPFYWSE